MCAGCYPIDRGCAEAVAGVLSQSLQRWQLAPAPRALGMVVAHSCPWSLRWHRWLMPTPEPTAVVGACSWSPCRQCPVALECMCREGGCYVRSRPSPCVPSTMAPCLYGGPGLLLRTPLVSVIPKSSPLRLSPHSQPLSSPQV